MKIRIVKSGKTISLLFAVLMLAAYVLTGCASAGTASEDNGSVDIADGEKGYEIRIDGEFDIKNAFPDDFSFFSYEHGIQIPAETCDLPTDDLVAKVGYLYAAQMSLMLSSRSYIGEISPVSVGQVIDELRSRDDALTALLSRYYTVTEALFSLSESEKASIKDGAVYTQQVAGWCRRAVDNLYVIRSLISSGYLSSVTRNDRQDLFERDKKYQVFLCRYYYIPLDPFVEISKTVDFDVDCLEYLKDVDCSAYDYEFSTDGAIMNEAQLAKLDTPALIEAGIRMLRTGWSSAADAVSSFQAEKRYAGRVISEINWRNDAAALFVEKYAELVHLTPYVSNDNEYNNIYYEKQALRVILTGGLYDSGSIAGLFSDDQLLTLYNLTSKDRIQSDFGKYYSEDSHDLLYNLYFSLQ